MEASDVGPECGAQAERARAARIAGFMRRFSLTLWPTLGYMEAMRRERRTVYLGKRVGRTRARAHTALWAFGLADLAALLGRSERTVRRLVATGALDPSDLAAVCAEWLARRR